jgi:hypothetical protein
MLAPRGKIDLVEGGCGYLSTRCFDEANGGAVCGVRGRPFGRGIDVLDRDSSSSFRFPIDPQQS